LIDGSAIEISGGFDPYLSRSFNFQLSTFNFQLSTFNFPLSLLARAESFLQEWVAPRSHEIDRSPHLLRQALQGLGDRTLLALSVDADDATYRVIQEAIARYSGALAFLQAQHQSAAKMLWSSANTALKMAYLPHMAKGDRPIGVGFSHLRRTESPPVSAIAVPGGYRIDGCVPWVTGWDCFQAFILGAALPDGTAVFGLVPLATTAQPEGGSIALSNPLELAAMASTNTVTAQIQHWFLADRYVVKIEPPGWIHAHSQKNVLHHSFFALGCARAGLDVVWEIVQRRQQTCVTEAFTALDRQLLDCRQAIFSQQLDLPFDGSLQGDRADCNPVDLRARAIALAVRCGHAAVTVSGGAANLSQHPAQRIYREALAYTVFGQTVEVMSATLAQLF
jgi:alkylation response protein AidB-like acyl-CoA dehydrogenase